MVRFVVEEVSLTGHYRTVRIENAHELNGLRVRVGNGLMFDGYRPGEELTIDAGEVLSDGTVELLVSIRRPPA